MQIDFTHAPNTFRTSEVERGNIYRNQKGRFYLVVAFAGDTAYYLTYDNHGEIVGVGQAAISYLCRMLRVGKVDPLPTLDVEWEVGLT